MNILTHFLNFIKFEHSIFALPFALSGALLATNNTFPRIHTIGWIVLAMVGGRSFAMSVNRIIDKDIDTKNPRTENRELPKGSLTKNQAVLFALVSLFIFTYATFELSVQYMNN